MTDLDPGTRVRIYTNTSTDTSAPRDVPLYGTVKRIWGHGSRNVTVITDDGRTFVRLAADVTPEPGPHFSSQDTPGTEVTVRDMNGNIVATAIVATEDSPEKR